MRITPGSRGLRRVLRVSLTVVVVCACAPPGAAQSEPAHLRAVDGGAEFYSQFTNGLPTDPGFFPLGVWSESVVDNTGWPIDKAAGLNTYVEPVVGTDLDIIAEAGMYSIAGRAHDSATKNGFFTEDEVDMWAGAGDGTPTGLRPGEGDICTPAESNCGYTLLRELADAAAPDQMVYTNYGKGVTFWDTDAAAARYINEFQDVVSADNYWFTDPNICAATEGGSVLGSATDVPDDRCRLAANYGRTIDRVRSLVADPGTEPVWAFIELSMPFKGEYPAITAEQTRAAVWSSIIHGARGIVYFNHNFGGDCQSQHVLRDCDPSIREGLTATNEQVTSLAPVLNAPFVDGAVTSDSAIDVATKFYDGALYVIAGSTRAGPQTARLELACGASTSADVVDEDRTVPVVDGSITDDFADGNAVHIYRVDDPCGLQ